MDRKDIIGMLMSRLGANGGGIYERNKRNRQWSGNQFTIAPTESVIGTTSPLDPERTKRMMLDRMYGNNDPQSPYYKGRWMAPGNPGANLAERAKDLAKGTDGSLGGGAGSIEKDGQTYNTGTPTDNSNNPPMAPSYEPSMQFPQEKPMFDFSDKLRKSGSLPNGIRFGGLDPNKRKKWGNF